MVQQQNPYDVTGGLSQNAFYDSVYPYATFGPNTALQLVLQQMQDQGAAQRAGISANAALGAANIGAGAQTASASISANAQIQQQQIATQGQLAGLAASIQAD